MLDALRRITHNFAQEPNLDLALATLVTDIKQCLNTDCCSIYLADEDQKQLRLKATDGLSPEAVGQTIMRFDEGLTGWVAERGEPIKVQNAQQHPRFKQFDLIEEDIYSGFLGVPIMHRRKVLGVISLQHCESRDFEQQEEAFLVTLSAQLAATFANVSLRLRNEATPNNEHSGLVFNGVSGAPGIGIGHSYLVQTKIEFSDVSLRKVSAIEPEKSRYFNAIEDTRKDISEMTKRMSSLLPKDALAIFDVYQQMLDAADLGNEVVAKINQGWCAVSALKIVSEKYVAEFEKMEDPYIRERAVDVKDLSRRLLEHLTKQEKGSHRLPSAAIVIAEEVTASMLAEIPRDQIKGLVSLKGAENSHAAIMARALGIPAVLGLRDVPIFELNNTDIIVDGYSGRVFINPNESIVEEYRDLESQDIAFSSLLKQEADEVASTQCGRRIQMYINSGMGFDIDIAEQQHIEGIGLYRTEYLYMMRQRFPSEQEQISFYQQVLAEFSGKPVVMRTLDVGGDKQLPYFPISEENPFLGWRGIRLTLDHPEIFLVQIRAMIKANILTNNLYIMLPMIADVAEVEEANRLISQAYNEVCTEIREVQPDANVPRPKVGVMVEVPSLIYQLPHLKGKIDFCSIGTNDLTQYLLAVDRNNDKVASLYDAYHPSVLNAIQKIFNISQEMGIECSVCGELAGDPGGAMLLTGMGFTQLSMNKQNVLRVKWVLKKSPFETLSSLVDDVLKCTRPDQVKFRVNRTILNIGAAGLLRAGN